MANLIRRRDVITLAAGAAASPIVCRLGAAAEQRNPPVIGFLDTNSIEATRGSVVGFRMALREAGFIEGQNVAIEFRFGNNQPGLRELARDLVRLQVAVIVTSGGVGSSLAAKAATSTTPIVLTGGADPVRFGLVASLNRPGGNITGMTAIHNELAGKRLDLLLKLVPEATIIGYLTVNQVNEGDRGETAEFLAAAGTLGRQIIVLECRDVSDFETAFATMVERQAGALVVSAFPLAFNNRNKILGLAAHHKIPTIYAQSQYVYGGGLMSYSAVVTWHEVVDQYVARILKGDKPADLPVRQPTYFELIINLKTAKALGLEVPPLLLAIADKVIEYELPREAIEYRRPGAWNVVPTITVVSAAGDPRLPLVSEAVAFWNDTFAELGTPFRLGALTQVVGAIPVHDLTMLNVDFDLPETLNRITGNIIVALSEGEFISFTARRPALNKAVVAIKDYRSSPLTLPNVARNLIALGLGQAIGLFHNDDPTTLMCGRPAPCRPDHFASDRPRYFPLTEAEKAELQRMYPRSWQASR
jgi:putative tryptophan/tyrosine transport system substrate-binding protein